MQKYQSSPKGIYRNLLKRGKQFVDINQDEFIDWYNVQEKNCVYCNIPESLVKKFAKGKMKSRLTIDKINPKENYKLGNICLACGICNMTKNDIFNVDDMKIIGKIIENKWRLL